ncbi:MAG: hypothetical protein AAF089_06935 [Bacteroidota bacterium]
MSEPDALTRILIALEDGRTRATYGAVAGVINATARFLMNGRPRDPLHSWVVSKETGRPTRYTEDEQHAELFVHDRVIDTPEALRAYLDERGVALQ